MERAPLEPCSENVRVVGDVAAGQRLRGPSAYTDIMVRGRCLCMGGTAIIRTLYTRVETAVREGYGRYSEAAQHLGIIQLVGLKSALISLITVSTHTRPAAASVGGLSSSPFGTAASRRGELLEPWLLRAWLSRCSRAQEARHTDTVVVARAWARADGATKVGPPAEATLHAQW